MLAAHYQKHLEYPFLRDWISGSSTIKLAPTFDHVIDLKKVVSIDHIGIPNATFVTNLTYEVIRKFYW